MRRNNVKPLETRIDEQRQRQKNPTYNKAINEQLIKATQARNIQLVKQLLARAADPNYIHIFNKDGWYPGDTDTPLSIAFRSSISNAQSYIDMLQALLTAGSDVTITVRRGSWNHWSDQSIFSGYSLPSKLKQIGKWDLQRRFLDLLIKYQVNLFTQTSISSYLEYFGFGSKVEELPLYKQQQNPYILYHQKEQKLAKQFQQYLNKRNIHKFGILSQYYNEKIKTKKGRVGNIWKHRSIFTQDKEKNTEFNSQMIFKLIQLSKDLNTIMSNRPNLRRRRVNRDPYFGLSSDDQYYYQGQLNYYQGQTILHRAIMHNNQKLVAKLLQLGCDPKIPCTISIIKLTYPNQWSPQLVKKKTNKNTKRIKQAEEQIKQMEQNLRMRQNMDENQKISNRFILQQKEFEIFKGKRFSIENEAPLISYQRVKIGCLQIAKQCNVKQEIVNLLNLYLQRMK